MTPVKLNVYISYTGADRKAVETLRDWLYPMRDEVNVWFNDPPKAPKPLPLPWELIASVLPVFRPRDYRKEYAKVDRRRKERAHIYLFMTSYTSLNDGQVDNDITLAVDRRIEGDMLSPQIYPVILAPSMWKDRSRLARFEPIGPKKSLSEFKPADEGYLAITQQLSKVITDMQRSLDEAKYAQSRLKSQSAEALPAGTGPYLGDEDDLLEFRAPAQMNPPEWLGWMIIFFLFLSVARGLQGDKPEPTISSHIQNAKTWQPEYERKHPPVQPRVDVPMRPVE